MEPCPGAVERDKGADDAEGGSDEHPRDGARRIAMATEHVADAASVPPTECDQLVAARGRGGVDDDEVGVVLDPHAASERAHEVVDLLARSEACVRSQPEGLVELADLLDDVRAGIVGEVVDAGPAVRDEEAYDALVVAARSSVDEGSSAAVHDVMRVLEAWRTTDKAISGRADLMTLPALTDMRAQVGRLMAPGFIGEAGVTRLRDYPRYLRAVAHRRERLDAQVARDRQLMDQLSGLQEAWLHAVAALPDGQPVPQHLRDARWLLEEYRVSLFAQQLGTREKVSDQRIRKVMGRSHGA